MSENAANLPSQRAAALQKKLRDVPHRPGVYVIRAVSYTHLTLPTNREV